MDMQLNSLPSEAHHEESIVDEEEQNDMNLEGGGHADVGHDGFEDSEDVVDIESLRNADEAQIKMSPLWKFYLVGKHHKRSGYREAFCKACIRGSGRYIPMRGDNPRMWRHLNVCSEFPQEDLDRMIASGRFEKYNKKTYVKSGAKRSAGTAFNGEEKNQYSAGLTSANGLPVDGKLIRLTNPQMHSGIKEDPKTVYVLNNSTFHEQSLPAGYHLEPATFTSYSPDQKSHESNVHRKSVVHFQPPQIQTPSSGAAPTTAASQSCDEFGSFVAMTLSQYPEAARTQLMKILKKSMAQFCLDYETGND